MSRFVINAPSADEKENFVQAVKVEKCLRDGDPCNLVTCDGSATVCRYGFFRSKESLAQKVREILHRSNHKSYNCPIN